MTPFTRISYSMAVDASVLSLDPLQISHNFSGQRLVPMLRAAADQADYLAAQESAAGWRRRPGTAGTGEGGGAARDALSAWSRRRVTAHPPGPPWARMPCRPLPVGHRRRAIPVRQL
jgi:hypothetical protein